MLQLVDTRIATSEYEPGSIEVFMAVARSVFAALLLAALAYSATLGTVVPIVGGAADIVLDEPRGRLYLVNSGRAQIEVYSIAQRQFLPAVKTDALPLSAAMSRDGSTLYVVSYDGTALNVINLNSLTVIKTVSLPAKPEGVAVGTDNRVLISTIGTGANNTANVLLTYDPNAADTNSVQAVQITPAAPASPVLPAPSGRLFLASRSQLLASKDGSTIVGVNLPNATLRVLFVYEVASGTVVRSRTVGNVSSVLSISSDGSKFMAGLSLFDTATLQIVAQQNTANSPYPFQPGTNFNTQQNQGGSVFSPDNSVLYSAFNIAPVQNPPGRANVSQLMLNDPDNLLIRLGLQLPENLAGKMVISSNGGTIYALSESGFVNIPLNQLNQNPIAAPESTVSLLVSDQCGVNATARSSSINVRNDGRGRLTVSAQVLQTTPTGPGGLGGVGGAGGGAPGGGVIIIVPPGANPGTTIPPILPGGTTPVTNAGVAATAPAVRTQTTADGARIDLSYTTSTTGRAPGTVSPTHTFLIQSPEAVNIPPAVRVFQNFRDSESRGEILPIPVGTSANEALEDMVMDPARQRIYIANSGLNRVDVYDIRGKEFLTPIKVGQLPRSLALTPDAGALYVANTGGESISIIDPGKLQVTGQVKFPPLPFNSNAPLMTPSVLAAGVRGLQVLMNNGTIWRVVGNEASPRNISPIIGASTIPQPRTMVSTPGGEYIMLLAGNGSVYLYDSVADEFVQGRQVFNNPITGFYGPVAAGPRGQYFVANGMILNEALTPTNAVGVDTSGRPVVGTSRPISAVAAIAGNTFARFTQPVRANANALPADAPTIELVDINTGNTMRSVAALEGPLTTQVGAARTNINGRMMAVDTAGTTAYALTTSGLSIVPLDPPAPVQDRPTINPNGTVSLSSYTQAFAPGSLISIFGRNLGRSDYFTDTPLPTIMGGTCVTLNGNPLPLIMTSAGQINAQIPPELPVGRYPVVIRSIDTKSASAAQQITIAKYAPNIFTDPETRFAAIYHPDGRPVSKSSPAKRDEPLLMFATGLGPVKGGRMVSGNPSPSSPLAVTDPVELFFGDPRIQQAEIIVDWSGLTPGFIGVYQLNIRVPGEHIRGEALPVTLRVGGVESQKTGPAVPIVAVD